MPLIFRGTTIRPQPLPLCQYHYQYELPYELPQVPYRPTRYIHPSLVAVAAAGLYIQPDLHTILANIP